MNTKVCLFILCLFHKCSSQFESLDDFGNYISPEDLEFLHDSVNATEPDSTTTPEGHWIGNRHWPDDTEDSTADDDGDDPIVQENSTRNVWYKPRSWWKNYKKFFRGNGSSIKRWWKKLTLKRFGKDQPDNVDCFGLGKFAKKLRWMFNLRPATAKKLNIQYFMSSRKQRERVEVYSGDQFGLEWVDYDPKRTTVVIVHGFLSHSNASWVRNLTNAFLDWNDVNVIAVDWSRGGNTWKYWRAVANTRTVGADLTMFLQQLMNQTGCETKDFHFVGHSLGAHICSYAASRLGGVRRITGLDPAQPCFRTEDKDMYLDSSDADFVDVIHTNGRLLSRLGFGLPDPTGDADFYPNGGMKQPGCYNNTKSFFGRFLPISPTSKYVAKLLPWWTCVVKELNQAVCSHGRAYLLFTESLLSKNCSFMSQRWNMSYYGVNASLNASCDMSASCAVMGIDADGGASGRTSGRTSGRLGDNKAALRRASGQYFVVTTDARPFCPSEFQKHEYRSPHLMSDLLKGFAIFKSPAAKEADVGSLSANLESDTPVDTTTKKPKWKFWG